MHIIFLFINIYISAVVSSTIFFIISEVSSLGVIVLSAKFKMSLFRCVDTSLTFADSLFSVFLGFKNIREKSMVLLVCPVYFNIVGGRTVNAASTCSGDGSSSNSNFVPMVSFHSPEKNKRGLMFKTKIFLILYYL